MKMPKGAPLLDGLEVPERDLAGREFATSQIASHCVSSKVDENREQKNRTGGRDRGRGASAGVMASSSPEAERSSLPEADPQ